MPMKRMRNLKFVVFVLLLIVFTLPPHSRAQETAKEPTAATAGLDRLRQEGRDAFYAGDYQTALEKWQAGLEQTRALNDKQYISRFLNNIGAVYDALGQYREASMSFQSSLDIDAALGTLDSL